MNPDTKVTIDQIKAICSQHNIAFHSYSRITTGFSHEVHRLNDDLVIKFYNAENLQSYKTESALLASKLPFLKPKLIAKGEKDGVIDRNYVIMTYVPGKSLGINWHLTTDVQRDKLIKDICYSLKIINQIKSSDIELQAKESWESELRKRGQNVVAKLRSRNIIDDQLAERVLLTFKNRLHVLANSPMYPVFWDIHFDNIIVNDNFELQALIDLENVELASLDYPLFVVQKLTDEPEKYLSEENEKYANKKDYENLKELYEKYYPEMFAFDQLETRIKIYLLLDTLHLLIDWSHVKELYTKIDELTS